MGDIVAERQVRRTTVPGCWFCLTARVPSLDDATWPVRTDRLMIRRALPADADATFVYRTLESVSRWIPRHSIDRDEYAGLWVSPDWTSRFLVVELDGVVICDVMLHIEDAWGQVEAAAQARGVQGELGWCLDPAYEGHGYATEAVRALIDGRWRTPCPADRMGVRL